ncbi:MAG: AI-2E family transporter [Thermoflexales bacterium]|nr:AI-2E family transporter [Thermoflexales bacterium]
MISEPWSPYTKRIVIIFGLILGALALWRFRQVTQPLVVALLLAYVLSPVVDFGMRRLRLGRTLATALVYLVLIVIVLVAVANLIPVITAQVRSINLDFQGWIATAESWLDYTLVLGQWSFDVQSLVRQVGGELRSLLSPLASGTLSLVVDVASGLLQTLFILIISFYMVKDAPTISAFFDELAPLKTREDLRRLGGEIGKIWNAFFRGQLTLCLVIGVIVTVMTSIVGLRSALVMGLLAGALEFIPNFGPVVATIPAVLLAAWHGSSWLPMSNLSFAVLVVVLYTLIQQVENNYLVPRIMGQQLNLHPLAVLIAVVAGASLAGVLGIFLAAPMLATLGVLVRYAYRKLQDEDPFPPPPPQRYTPSLSYRLKRLLFPRVRPKA